MKHVDGEQKRGGGCLRRKEKTRSHRERLYIIYLFIIIYFLYFNQFPTLRGRNASCHEMSESRRLVKLKDMKREIFPFMPLSCGLGHRRTFGLQGLHTAFAIYNWGISSKSRAHTSGNTRCIPSRKPSPYPPIMYHYPFLPDIQTPFLQAVLLRLNPSLPRPTHSVTTNTTNSPHKTESSEYKRQDNLHSLQSSWNLTPLLPIPIFKSFITASSYTLKSQGDMIHTYLTPLSILKHSLSHHTFSTLAIKIPY